MINKCIDKCDSNNMLNQHSGRFKYLQSKLCYFDIKIQIKNIIFYGFILNSFVCYLLFSIKPSVQSATVSDIVFKFKFILNLVTREEFWQESSLNSSFVITNMARLVRNLWKEWLTDIDLELERIPGYDQNSFFGTKFWCKFN